MSFWKGSVRHVRAGKIFVTFLLTMAVLAVVGSRFRAKESLVFPEPCSR
jgi:hypothetical protein